MLKVSAVPSQHIESIRHELAPWLKDAESWTRGRYTASDLLDLAEENRISLFIAFSPDGEDDIDIRGVALCFIQHYPRSKWLFIQYVGGDRSHLWRQNMHDLLKKYAQANGCVGFEWIGRLGLMRVMGASGAKPVGFMGEIRFDVDGRGPTK